MAQFPVTALGCSRSARPSEPTLGCAFLLLLQRVVVGSEQELLQTKKSLKIYNVNKQTNKQTNKTNTNKTKQTKT